MYILKYEKQLIDGYINGSDLGDYNIEQLEDNETFMREVFLECQDYRMYNMCSDRLKKDYDFIMFLINYFKEDYKIVNYFVENYFKRENDLVKRNEFWIGLSNLALSTNNKDLMNYQLVADQIYKVAMIEIKRNMKKMGKSWKNYFGKGFIFLREKFSDSEIIKDFFAKNMLDDLFLDYKLETYLHKHFKNKDEVLKYGLNSLIIRIIRSMDNSLADYVSIKPDLLEEERKKIVFYLNNWDCYERISAEYILRKLENYLSKNYICDKSLIKLIIVFVINKLNYQNIFLKSDSYANIVKNGIDLLNMMDESKFNTSEEIIVVEVENILKKEILGTYEQRNKKLIKVNFKNND